MGLGWAPRPRPRTPARSRALLLLLLSQLTLAGEGNEGSVFGSCYCNDTILSPTGPEIKKIEHIRKHLKAYDNCRFYVRFHLNSRKVCGGSKEAWVQELVSCFDHKECGRAHRKRPNDQKQLPLPSTLISEPTEAAPPDKSTLAQIQHTQPSPVPSVPLPSDNQFTLLHETATHTSAYMLGAGPEDIGNHREQKENGAATGSGSAVVPVLSLLAITLILIGVLLFLLCKRRKQSKEYSSDLQLQNNTRLITPDSNTPEPQMED